MLVTVGTTDGETYQKELEKTNQLLGKKIGDTFDGDTIGLDGYTLEITGGSDQEGFPMREKIEGAARRRKVIENGAGVQGEEKGVKKRKSVRGNTVSDEIRQLNTRVVEEGDQTVEELWEEEE